MLMRRSLMLWKQMELSHQGRNEAEGDGEVGGMGPLFYFISFFLFGRASDPVRKHQRDQKCVRSAFLFFLFFKTGPPGQRKYE